MYLRRNIRIALRTALLLGTAAFSLASLGTAVCAQTGWPFHASHFAIHWESVNGRERTVHQFKVYYLQGGLSLHFGWAIYHESWSGQSWMPLDDYPVYDPPLELRGGVVWEPTVYRELLRLPIGIMMYYAASPGRTSDYYPMSPYEIGMMVGEYVLWSLGLLLLLPLVLLSVRWWRRRAALSRRGFAVLPGSGVDITGQE